MELQCQEELAEQPLRDASAKAEKSVGKIWERSPIAKFPLTRTESTGGEF